MTTYLTNSQIATGFISTLDPNDAPIFTSNHNIDTSQITISRWDYMYQFNAKTDASVMFFTVNNGSPYVLTNGYYLLVLVKEATLQYKIYRLYDSPECAICEGGPKEDPVKRKRFVDKMVAVLGRLQRPLPKRK